MRIGRTRAAKKSVLYISRDVYDMYGIDRKMYNMI